MSVGQVALSCLRGLAKAFTLDVGEWFVLVGGERPLDFKSFSLGCCFTLLVSEDHGGERAVVVGVSLCTKLERRCCFNICQRKKSCTAAPVLVCPTALVAARLEQVIWKQPVGSCETAISWWDERLKMALQPPHRWMLENCPVKYVKGVWSARRPNFAPGRGSQWESWREVNNQDGVRKWLAWRGRSSSYNCACDMGQQKWRWSLWRQHEKLDIQSLHHWIFCDHSDWIALLRENRKCSWILIADPSSIVPVCLSIDAELR